ncbi:MAG: creatininase [Gammaproteobacteria bacterium]|nr:creatininase [Gammaproteobacteria bacterium]
MKHNILIFNMTWTEYSARTSGGSTPVLLPVGALEQHGPHLPMNCDTLIPGAVCQQVAGRIDALVAPPLSYGYKSQPRSGGGNHFPGTTSLDGNTLVMMTRDIIKEFARHGVRKVAVVVGHTENLMFTIEGCDLALRDLRSQGIRDLRIVHMGYWEFSSEQTLRKVFPDGFPSWNLEHAGVMETSIMLHLHPNLVQFDKVPLHPPADFPPYDIYPVEPHRIPSSGALSSAKTATADKGRLMLDEYIETISMALIDEFGAESFSRPDKQEQTL